MKLLPLLLLLLLPLAVRAQFLFVTNNGNITITAYAGSFGPVTVPPTINGHPVTSITNLVFYGHDITSASLPDSITNIGTGAFEQCLYLTNINIPTNLTFLREDVFEFCGSLPAITIPPNVTTIGTNAFTSCISLSSIILPASLTNLQQQAFASSGLQAAYFLGNAPTAGLLVFPSSSVVYYLPGTTNWGAALSNASTKRLYNCITNNGTIALTLYNGPAGTVALVPTTISSLPVTTLGNGTPVFNSFTTNVTIPDSISNLQMAAFAGSGLTSLTIPTNVTTLATNLFNSCNQLTNVVIPSGVTNISKGAFQECVALKSITIPNGVINIGVSAFANCSSLSNVVMGANVATIGISAFSGCPISSVTFSATLASLGGGAFSPCTNLTAVYFTGDGPSANSSVFSGDTKVIAYYLPGANGWDNFAFNTAIPVALWLPQMVMNGSSFLQPAQQFGFNITWAASHTIVVDASTNLNSTWSPLWTNTLATGSTNFSESLNYPVRFYRLRAP